MQYITDIGNSCNFQVSRGSVLTNVYKMYVQNFLENPEVKESWKSVYICQSYDQKSSDLVLETQVV